MENFATKVYNEKPFSFVAKLILGVFRVLGYASDPSIPHSSKLNFMTFIYQPERHISEVWTLNLGHVLTWQSKKLLQFFRKIDKKVVKRFFEKIFQNQKSLFS